MLQPCADTQKVEILPSMEEYVIVPQPDEIRNNDVFTSGDDGSKINDDDSYDYCEDAFSQGEFFADSDDDDNSVASQSCNNKDSIIISVPSGLMKDLDEAHAAAELARVSDASELIDSASVSTKDTPVQEPEESDAVSKQKTVVNGKKTLEASKSDNVEGSKSNARAENKASAAEVAANNLSRASNKKRRKKLKLMKKAQAAANAAEALAARTAAMSKMHQAKKIIPASTSRTTSRKVANLAVACARETMATYRQEVLCSSLS